MLRARQVGDFSPKYVEFAAGDEDWTPSVSPLRTRRRKRRRQPWSYRAGAIADGYATWCKASHCSKDSATAVRASTLAAARQTSS